MKTPLKAGSVRYKRDDEWVVAEPGSLLYSMAVFLAEESWDGEQWRSIIVKCDTDHELPDV